MELHAIACEPENDVSTNDSDETGAARVDPAAWVAVEVGGVTIDPESQTPVVLLRAVENRSWFLPIFVGGTEATAIAATLAGVDLPRPITHDLFARVLNATGALMQAAFVTSIHDGTFLAETVVTLLGGETPAFDSRPSDAVAMALRMGAPIYVARKVMDEAAGWAPDETPASEGESEELRPVRRRGPRGQPQPLLDADVDLDDLDPSVFGKYKM